MAINGISIGTIDFRIEGNGLIGDARMTEYRSVFKLDSLVSTFVPVEGRAATLVPDGQHVPSQSMNRYTARGKNVIEDMTFRPGALRLHSRRVKSGRLPA